MGSTSTKTETQNKDPWAPSQPHLAGIMNEGQRLYNSGAGTGVWNGPALAGMSQQTQQGLGATGQIANQTMGAASQPFYGALQAMQNGGMAQGSQQPINVLGGVASGQNGINTGGAYGQIANQSLTQNEFPNSVMGRIAAGGPNQNGATRALGLLPSALGQNKDAYGVLGNVSQGRETAADKYLGDMAQGGGANPFLQKMLDDNAARVSNRTNSAMAGSGRYGSFAHGDALARSIGEVNNPILAQAYESDQARRLQAAGLMDQSRLGVDNQRMMAASDLSGQRRSDTTLGANILTSVAGNSLANSGLQLNAANALAGGNRADLSGAMGAIGGLTGVQGQNIQNQTGAAGGMLDNFARGQSQAQGWAGLMPELNNLQYDPANRMMAAGGVMDARGQAELDNQRRIFEQQNAMPWQQLSNYQNSVSGLSGLLQGMGTSTGTSTQQQPFNPLTLAPLGMMMLSDRDEKTDIKKVGTSGTTGLPLYSYRYRDDPKSYPKVVGPMAQDIEKKYPGSTDRVDGKLVVLPHATGLLGAI